MLQERFQGDGFGVDLFCSSRFESCVSVFLSLFSFSNFCRILAFSDEDGFLKVVVSGLNHSAFGGDSTIR